MAANYPTIQLILSIRYSNSQSEPEVASKTLRITSSSQSTNVTRPLALIFQDYYYIKL